MIIKREGIFETNSSGSHTLVICTKEDYNRFCNGELYCDWNGNFFPKEEAQKAIADCITEVQMDGIDFTTENAMNEVGLFSSDYWFDDYDYDSFEESFKTPSGDEMVAFGRYCGQ